LTPPRDDLERLLDWLCTEWGYCEAHTAYALIERHPQMTPKQFAEIILRAEGLDPPLQNELRRKLARKYSEFMNI
jgi:hypothetical protein